MKYVREQQMAPLKPLVQQCCASDFSLRPPNAFGSLGLHKCFPFIYQKPLRVQVVGPGFFSVMAGDEAGQFVMA